MNNVLRKIRFLLLCLLFFQVNLIGAQQPEQMSSESFIPLSKQGKTLPDPSEIPQAPGESKEYLLKEKFEKSKEELKLDMNKEDLKKTGKGEKKEEKMESFSKIPDIEKKSEIEKLFSGEISPTVNLDLKQFGYDIFIPIISTFAPITDVPVGPDYTIGPEDSFTINLWGRFEASYKVVVDRNGEITIPKIGTIKVWGLTFSEMENLLQSEFSKYFKDFKMNLIMDKLRTIRVYIVGEAATPGSFSLSSLSTAYNALFSAGGPKKTGTMRNIQLLRNGELLQKIDLYDFLLKGDKSHDQKLQSGDTLFIPIIGSVVGIAGNVKRPALYEFKDNISLKELIELAGGITPFGYLQRVQVERIIAHEKRIVVDLNLSGTEDSETNPALKKPLQDGDFVKVYPISSALQQIVYLEGNVKRPGGYELKKEMRLNGLIKSFDDILPETYLPYGSILRTVPPDFHTETISFNLEKVLKGDSLQNLELQPQDKIKIYSINEMQEVPKVTITGPVKKPGNFTLLKEMKVSDLIFMAGNVLRNAYLPSAELTRIEKLEEKTVTKQIQIDLREVLKDNPEHNIILQPDDHLSIRNIPEWVLDNTINLTGEVKFPGIYTIAKSEHLSSVFERAGGFTDKAYIKGAFFTRESERLKVKARVDDFVSKLEQEILQESAPPVLATVSQEESIARREFLNLKTELVKKLKEAKIEGRIVVKLDSMDKFKDSKYDIVLEKNDTLYVPPVPTSVTIIGEVYNPVSLLHTKGATIADYLNKVGGPTNYANENEIYLIRADGTTISRLQGNSWTTEGTGWFTPSFMNIKAEPGDTILVPKKVIVLDYLKFADQVTRTIANIAATVAVIYGVTK